MALLSTVLIAHLAFAVVAWVVGLGIEKLGASSLARARVWASALVAAAAIAPGIWLVEVLNVPAPWPAPAMERFAFSPAQPAVGPVEDVALLSSADTVVEPGRSTTPGTVAAVALLMLLLGSAARLGGLGVRRRTLRRLVNASVPLNDLAVIDRVIAAAARFDVLAPQVRLSEVTAPLVLRTPRIILLPRALAQRLDAGRIALICGHEIAHLKRGDDWMMKGEDLLLALFWFNPIMSAIARRLSAAREEVCDQMAIGDAGRKDRQAYAETLISSFKLCSSAPVGLAFIGMRSNQAQRRLVAILTPARPSPTKTVLAAGVAVVLLGAAGGVSLAFADGPQPDPWLKPDSSGLTDADKAWLTMRSVETDIENQERYYSRAPDPVRMRAFITQSRAQVEAIRQRIDGKPISARARRTDRDAMAARDAEWAQVAQWDGPAPAGKVRATIYCPPGQPCVVRSLTPPPSARAQDYGAWAGRYGETFRQRFVVDRTAYGAVEEGALIKTDLSLEVLSSTPDPKDYKEFFLGSGPKGLPLSVVPPP